MRRFINSIFGKAVCQLVVLSLVLPSLQFVLLASRAEAQLQALPTWAVVEFEVKKPGGDNLGKVAAEAVANELAKSGRIDVVPQETITRTLEQLTIPSPVTDRVSLLRLANEVRAGTIVRGEVHDWRIRRDNGGKQADVQLRVVVIDVASGDPINGAALTGSSPVRASSVDDAALIADAITSAANQAVAQIRSTTLPTGTVLNTFDNEGLINQGARSGFKKGQRLIITRGATQVATASIIEVSPDDATYRVDRVQLGHQPGDRVRAVVEVPDIKGGWTDTGEPRLERPRSRGSNSGFTTLLLVVGLLGVLLSQGRSSNFTAAHDIKAEAMMFPNESGSPATRISWSRDFFVRGNQQTVQWQIHRSDVTTSPVLVVIGNESQGIDTTDARDVTYGDFNGQIGGSTCLNGSVPEETAAGIPGVTPGRPYSYSVELVYRVASIDLPDGGTVTSGTGGGTGTIGGTTGTIGGTTGGTTGTIGGTTGTTATTTGTTGGTTTGTTGGTNAAFCFFISPRAAGKGLATPLNRPGLQSPGSNFNITQDVPFQFTSVVNPAFPIQVEYVLQVSNSPNFVKGQTLTLGKVIRGDIGTLSIPASTYNGGGSNPLLNQLRNKFGSTANEFWWRVGARNVADKPGPVPDPSGQRYVFSVSNRFTIPDPPPPPPAE